LFKERWKDVSSEINNGDWYAKRCGLPSNNNDANIDVNNNSDYEKKLKTKIGGFVFLVILFSVVLLGLIGIIIWFCWKLYLHKRKEVKYVRMYQQE
jgi:cytoskeletal protein RodZ